MAILNLEYYTQKDLYSDGDIEEQMLKMAKEGVTCEELSSEQVSFPVIYHFSDLRANILNWYPIKKSDSVLEIGAGCGAITGTLCEKAGQVTSVELSKRRAQINYYRNEKKDNLTIMVGNLNDMDLGQQDSVRRDFFFPFQPTGTGRIYPVQKRPGLCGTCQRSPGSRKSHPER